jgi:hypothetical protein
MPDSDANAPTPFEQWRPIAETGGAYEVSDQGRVRRAAHMPGRWANRDNPPRAGHLGSSGYLQVFLFANGRSFWRTVHSLVATAFLGTRPPGMVVNHRNGRTTDNRAANLEWVTHSENMRHAHQVLGRRRRTQRSLASTA